MLYVVKIIGSYINVPELTNMSDTTESQSINSPVIFILTVTNQLADIKLFKSVSNFFEGRKMIAKRIVFFCTFAVVTLASPLPSSEASTNTSANYLQNITTGLHVLNNVTVS